MPPDALAPRLDAALRIQVVLVVALAKAADTHYIYIYMCVYVHTYTQYDRKRFYCRCRLRPQSHAAEECRPRTKQINNVLTSIAQELLHLTDACKGDCAQHDVAYDMIRSNVMQHDMVLAMT